MKVTLWQQFSSNHSASFTSVGKFQSVEFAEIVADEIRSMIREIGFWWEQYGDYKEQQTVEKRLRRKGEILTPPEQRIRDEYQVEWCRQNVTNGLMAIDWIRSQSADYAVQQHRKLVIIKPAQTWCGAHPFDLIMRKLGGEVASKVEDYSYLTTNFMFSAPDDETANLIQQKIRGIERGHESLIIIEGLGNATAGRLQRIGLQFTLSDVALNWAGLNRNLVENFETIMQFLEKHNCTNIEYQFHETITRDE